MAKHTTPSSPGCYFTKKVWDAQQAGASAVIVADDKDEPLITMDAPEDDPSANDYLASITIPSALITKELGDQLKKAIANKQRVQIVLDWSEAIAHPDERVEYEFWTNSNDECGQKCDVQVNFVQDFKAAAQTLEQGQYTLFTPHYITWYCPDAYRDSLQCQLQCINKGRYCAPDPEQDFEEGYDGRDVVVENLRQLCVFKEATAAKKPWVWWDYVSDFQIRCSMWDGNYDAACAEQVITSLGKEVGPQGWMCLDVAGLGVGLRWDGLLIKWCEALLWLVEQGDGEGDVHVTMLLGMILNAVGSEHCEPAADIG